MGKIIGIDTALLIYLFEDSVDFADASAKIMKKVEDGKYSAIFSCIGMIELMTGPKKLGRIDLAHEYKVRLMEFPNLRIIGINENIVDIASTLRAKYGIRTPDAIHIATAIDGGANSFITNDKLLQKIKEIKVVLLSDVLN